jgi:hypothetical protein
MQALLPAPNSEIIFQPVEDGAVLLHVAEEIYYGLNGVGARIWQGLPPAHDTLDALCAHMSAEYPEVPHESIRQDIVELLADLEVHGLVHPLPGGSSREDSALPAT